MIGIIGAMKIEVETIRSMLENKEEKQIGGVLFVKGLLRGREVVTAECGIGKVAAAICTQTMIMEYAPDCIINTGVGGSLSDELDVCDAVVGEYLVQHDMDTTPLGDPPGLISGLGIVEIPADKEVCDKLKAAAEKAGINKVIKGIIASGDQFIAGKEKKDFIKNTFGAVCCEMEGASIAQTCYSSGVPFAVLRTVSDKADGSSHVTYSEFLPAAADLAAKTIINFCEG